MKLYWVHLYNPHHPTHISKTYIESNSIRDLWRACEHDAHLWCVFDNVRSEVTIRYMSNERWVVATYSDGREHIYAITPNAYTRE